MEINRCPGCMQPRQNHPICEHCGWDENSQNLPHQLPVGTILRGQYYIGRVLGQGGFGITYLGWDLYLDMPVAIKEYFPSNYVTRDAGNTNSVTSYSEGSDQEYEANKERFMREGKALARFVKLKNIVQIHSFFPENNTVYIVMEYAKGMTLKDRLKKTGPMSLAQVLTILEPIMEDLQEVHRAGVVHRDISPDNIMLLEEGGAKLLDFGAVKEVANPSQDREMSKSTEAILKQGFAPVEQYNSKGALGPWTDVYALCATICYCISGKVPEFAPDRTISDNPDKFLEELPGISHSQREALRRGMALRPKERTGSVAQLMKELKTEEKKAAPVVSAEKETAIKGNPAPKKKPAVSPAGSGTKQKKGGLWAAALVLLLLAGGLGIRHLGSASDGADSAQNLMQVIDTAAERVTGAVGAREPEMPEETTEPTAAPTVDEENHQDSVQGDTGTVKQEAAPPRTDKPSTPPKPAPEPAPKPAPPQPENKPTGNENAPDHSNDSTCPPLPEVDAVEDTLPDIEIILPPSPGAETSPDPVSSGQQGSTPGESSSSQVASGSQERPKSPSDVNIGFGP